MLKEIIKHHPNSNIALVAHGGTNRIVLLDAIGAPLARAFAIEQDYGCVNIIDYYEDGNTVVKLLNSTVHQTTTSSSK